MLDLSREKNAAEYDKFVSHAQKMRHNRQQACTQEQPQHHTTLVHDSLDLSAFHAWQEMPAEGETTWYLVGGISIVPVLSASFARCLVSPFVRGWPAQAMSSAATSSGK